MHNRQKLEKAFTEGAFGMPDIPLQIGHKLQARMEHRDLYRVGREDKRSWKRRRRTKWRPK